MIPTSEHNEALSGDTLYSAFLNHEWREIVVPFIVAGLEKLAATIEDESDRQDFEVRYGALIDDLYNEDIVDSTPVGSVVWFPSPTIPDKWLKCNGTTRYRSDYPELWDLLVDFRLVEVGTGLDLVGLPHLTDKFLWGASSDAVIGDIGGEIEHTLTEAELPAHTHTIAHTNQIPASNNAGTTANRFARGAALTATDVTGGSSSPNSGSVGSGNAHNNMPPYMRGYFIIKALP